MKPPLEDSERASRGNQGRRFASDLASLRGLLQGSGPGPLGMLWGPAEGLPTGLCALGAPGPPLRTRSLDRGCPLFSLHPGASRCRYLCRAAVSSVPFVPLSGRHASLSLSCLSRHSIGPPGLLGGPLLFGHAGGLSYDFHTHEELDTKRPQENKLRAPCGGSSTVTTSERLATQCGVRRRWGPAAPTRVWDTPLTSESPTSPKA